MFKRNMTSSISMKYMANPIGVKGIGKYEVKDAGNMHSVTIQERWTPVHVKAAINYNSLIDHWYEGKRYEKIWQWNKRLSGCIWKKMTFGFDTQSHIKGHEDPREILEYD